VHGAGTRHGPRSEYQLHTMPQLTERIGHHSLILHADPEGVMGAFIRRVCELIDIAGFVASFTDGEQGLAGRRGIDA
jgi:hypothetical protein